MWDLVQHNVCSTWRETSPFGQMLHVGTWGQEYGVKVLIFFFVFCFSSKCNVYFDFRGRCV
jgi:hypothetical protein